MPGGRWRCGQRDAQRSPMPEHQTSSSTVAAAAADRCRERGEVAARWAREQLAPHLVAQRRPQVAPPAGSPAEERRRQHQARRCAEHGTGRAHSSIHAAWWLGRPRSPLDGQWRPAQRPRPGDAGRALSQPGGRRRRSGGAVAAWTTSQARASARSFSTSTAGVSRTGRRPARPSRTCGPVDQGCGVAGAAAAARRAMSPGGVPGAGQGGSSARWRLHPTVAASPWARTVPSRLSRNWPRPVEVATTTSASAALTGGRGRTPSGRRGRRRSTAPATRPPAGCDRGRSGCRRAGGSRSGGGGPTARCCRCRRGRRPPGRPSRSSPR